WPPSPPSPIGKGARWCHAGDEARGRATAPRSPIKETAMSTPKRRPVSRRHFIATLAATSMAASTFAILARDASAATTAQGSNGAASPSLNTGETPMINHVTPSTASGPPTVVLVHGAFADSSSWNGVVARLLAQNYSVVAVANPLRGLKADS